MRKAYYSSTNASLCRMINKTIQNAIYTNKRNELFILQKTQRNNCKIFDILRYLQEIIHKIIKNGKKANNIQNNPFLLLFYQLSAIIETAEKERGRKRMIDNNLKLSSICLYNMASPPRNIH